MMDTPEKLGAEHWRTRAAEARMLAEEMSDAASRHRMLRIAADYDKLATRARIRAALAGVEGAEEG